MSVVPLVDGRCPFFGAPARVVPGDGRCLLKISKQTSLCSSCAYGHDRVRRPAPTKNYGGDCMAIHEGEACPYSSKTKVGSDKCKALHASRTAPEWCQDCDFWPTAPRGPKAYPKAPTPKPKTKGALPVPEAHKDAPRAATVAPVAKPAPKATPASVAVPKATTKPTTKTKAKHDTALAALAGLVSPDTIRMWRVMEIKEARA